MHEPTIDGYVINTLPETNSKKTLEKTWEWMDHLTIITWMLFLLGWKKTQRVKMVYLSLWTLLFNKQTIFLNTAEMAA